MLRPFLFSFLLVTFAGCQRYAATTPVRHIEGEHHTAYRRVFKTDPPATVEVVNSVVAFYGFRPGVVTTDDFEFELIAPDAWIASTQKQFHLRKGDAFQAEVAARRQRARPWYAPGQIDQYETYRDPTSVGYVHMLAQKKPEPDGRRRVFISKH